MTLRFPVAGQRKVRTTVIIKRHVCSRGNFPYSSNDGNEILILPLRFGRAFGMCPRNCPRQTALNFKTGRLNTRCGVARCARAAWIPSGAKLEVTGLDGTGRRWLPRVIASSNGSRWETKSFEANFRGAHRRKKLKQRSVPRIQTPGKQPAKQGGRAKSCVKQLCLFLEPTKRSFGHSIRHANEFSLIRLNIKSASLNGQRLTESTFDLRHAVFSVIGAALFKEGRVGQSIRRRLLL